MSGGGCPWKGCPDYYMAPSGAVDVVLLALTMIRNTFHSVAALKACVAGTSYLKPLGLKGSLRIFSC